MTEIITPVITEVGKIWGRDAIFLHKVNYIDEQTFELIGEFTGSCCSSLENHSNVKYMITFNNVLLFKMTELDFDEVEYSSSFDCIENSKQLHKMIQQDSNAAIHKIDRTYKHFVFRTYDTVFEIIGKDFVLAVGPQSAIAIK